MQYDEKNDVYLDRHVHNWASHGVDAYQSMTIALEEGYVSNKASTGVFYMNDKNHLKNPIFNI